MFSFKRSVSQDIEVEQASNCEEQKNLLNAYKSSLNELKLNHETLLASHDELLEKQASLIKIFTKKLKNNESSSHGSNDQSHVVANPCDVDKKHVSTSCDDLLDMPCSSHIDACSTSMSCETNILKENNELKNEVKKLRNKLERCYNSKVTFEHMLKTQRYCNTLKFAFFKIVKFDLFMQLCAH